MVRLVAYWTFLAVCMMAFIISCQDSNFLQNNPPPTNDQGLASGSVNKEKDVGVSSADIIPGQYIVVFKDQTEGIISKLPMKRFNEPSQF